MSRKLCRSEKLYAARSASTLGYASATPFFFASANSSSGSSVPWMCRCSSALGIARSSSASRWRGMRSNARAMATGARSCASLRTNCAPARRSLLVGSRHLALDALDEEVDAAEELVVGDGILGQDLLAVVARDRSLPDHEAAVLQARFHLLDLVLDVCRHLV